MTRIIHTLLIAVAFICTLIAINAVAQSEEKYVYLDLNTKVPETLWEGGRIKWMKGGVDLTLRGETPEVVPLQIRCRDMVFSYDGEAPRPVSVDLTGDVFVDNGEYRIQSAKAVLDLNTNRIKFDGNVRAKIGEGGELNADSADYDMNTGDILTHGVTGKGLTWQSTGGPASPITDPSLLTESDLSDVPGFVAKLKDQANGAASPGKHILSLASAKARTDFLKAEPEQVPASVLVKQLNAALKSKKFYDQTSWVGVTLDPETAELLAKGPETLPAGELTKLNRGLLAAAFPAHVKAR